jgi:hypothetical protein
MVSLPGSAFANLNSADLRSTRRFSEFANGIKNGQDYTLCAGKTGKE